MLITLLSNIFIGNISLFSIGISFIVIISLLTLIFAVMLKDGEYLPYLLSGFMFAAVPFFAPRMHERYFFPALALCIIAMVLANKKIMLLPISLLSASGFLIVSDVMMGLLVGGNLKNNGAEYAVYADYYWPAYGAIPDLYRGLIAILMLTAVLALFFIMVLSAFESITKVNLTGGKLFETAASEKEVVRVKKEGTR